MWRAVLNEPGPCCTHDRSVAWDMESKQRPPLRQCDCTKCNGKWIPQSTKYTHDRTRPRAENATHASHLTAISKFLANSLDDALSRKQSMSAIEDQVANHIKTLHPSDPKRSLFPTQFDKMVEFIAKNAGIPLTDTVSYHVCPNDCILFYGPYADETVCPQCKAGRYDAAGAPRRTYPYLPLIPRLKRCYGVPGFSELLNYIMTRPIPEEGLLRDVPDGARWKKGYLDTIGASKYHAAFGVGADGINIADRDQYSVIPLILTWFNIPPHLRKTWRFLMLLGVIPGPGCNNVTIFLWPLKDELQLLAHDSHVWVYDALTRSHHVLKAALICGVFDTRALPKVAMTNQSPGAVMCHRCKLVGQRGIQTAAYEEAWRNLPVGDPLREKLYQQRLKGCTASSDSGRCEKRTPQSVLKAAMEAEASPLKVTNSKHPGKTSGIQGLPFLHGLVGWCICDSPEADIFHQQSNDGLRNISAMHGAKKPYVFDVKVRQFEAERKRWLDVPAGGQPDHQLRRAELPGIRLRSSLVRPPRHLGCRLPDLSSSKGLKKIKGHEWKLLLSDIGIYIFGGAFHDRQQYSLLWFDRCRAWKALTATEQRLANLESQQHDWEDVAARGEYLLPTACQSSTNHFTLHGTDTIKNLGPAKGHWMYGEERFGERVIKQTHACTNKEDGMIKVYKAVELLTLVRIQFPEWFNGGKQVNEDGDGSCFVMLEVDPTSWRRGQRNWTKHRVLTLDEAKQLESVCGFELSTEATAPALVEAPRRVFRSIGQDSAPADLNDLKYQNHVVEYLPSRASEGCTSYDGLQYGVVLETLDVRCRGREETSPTLVFKVAPLRLKEQTSWPSGLLHVPLPLVASPAQVGVWEWILADCVRAETTPLVCPALEHAIPPFTHFLLRL